MKYQISDCISLTVADRDAALRFNEEMVGPSTGEGREIALQSRSLHLFVDEGAPVGPVLELEVADLTKAREDLRSRGFTELRWGGVGESNYVRDPHGIVWNIWQIR